MAPQGLTRFAPAPTGLLHLGHVANAIYVWGFGRTRATDVLLRIEDHDRQRSRREYETHLIDDLDWLGFRPDRFPTDTFRGGRCESRQSDRGALYTAVAADLIARNLVYGCRCSRQDLARRPDAIGPGMAYPGTCRDRGHGLEGDVAWRVRLDGLDPSPPDLLGDNARDLRDVEPGDPVIRDRRGNWTYQFAVVVDDHHQGIDLVIRGRDLADSTRLQITLGRLIGRPEPARFAHHPLIMKSPTAKLSKSDGDAGVAALRAAGWTAARVIGHAAHLVGLATVDRPLAAAEVGSLFR